MCQAFLLGIEEYRLPEEHRVRWSSDCCMMQKQVIFTFQGLLS